MLETPKRFVELASSVLDFVKGIKVAERDRLKSLAALLGQIADCLERIIRYSKKGEFSPTVRCCEELGLYFKHFSRLDLGKFLDAEGFDLLEELQYAIGARRGMIFAWNFVDDKDQKSLDENILQIERAAGAFRAAQNLMTATA